jgi:hypothetical protein
MLLGNLVNAENESVLSPLITKSRRSVLHPNGLTCSCAQGTMLASQLYRDAGLSSLLRSSMTAPAPQPMTSP